MDEPSAILDDGGDRHALRRRPPAHLRGRRRRLHLASPRRDPAHRRPGDRPRRRPHGRDRASRDDPDRRAGRADGGPQGGAALPRAPGRRRPSAARGARRPATPAVRGVSLQVHAGEVVGLGGLVGSGRTELLRLIYGLDEPEAGEVVLEGKRLRAGNPRARDPARAWGSRPRTASHRRSCSTGADQERDASPTSAASRRACSTSAPSAPPAREQLRALNTVPDDPDRVVRLLSGGNQQKVVLARWLLHQCRVLLLDEPTRGVDVATKASSTGSSASLRGRARRCSSSRPSSKSSRHLHPHPRHARGRDRRRARRSSAQRSASCSATPSRPPMPPISSRRSTMTAARQRRRGSGSPSG